MKKRRTLLLGLISLILAIPVQGQIITKYEQGFENSGETYSYQVVSGSAAPQTTLASSGSRALKLTQGTTATVVKLDTIDFTDNGSYQFFVMEFMHINDVNPLWCASGGNVAIIEVKRVDQSESQWTRLNYSYYDMSWGGGSSDFTSSGSFSQRSYAVWQTGTPQNSWWKKERFNLNNFFQSTALANRKLMVRITMQPRTSGTPSGAGWYIDGIKVMASTQSMSLPTIKMVQYPDLMAYPSSRDTRIICEVNTPAVQGMNIDSMYVLYRLGNSSVSRAQMHALSGTTNRYYATIPFCGYDTLVSYRIVCKDATTNNNTVTFPVDANGWEHYYSVRGHGNEAFLSEATTSTNLYPFPAFGDGRFEFFYDSATLAEAGYKAGAMTGLKYTTASSSTSSGYKRRENFQIYLRNVDDDFSVATESGTTNLLYTTDGLKLVCDTDLTINMSSGAIGSFNFQDTFFYAGKHIVAQLCYDNDPNDPEAISIKTFPAAEGHPSIYKSVNGVYHFSPLTSGFFNAGTSINTRPNFSFKAVDNLPLIYDGGVSSFNTPSETNSVAANTNTPVVVKLHNYGAHSFSGVRIWYKVDNEASHYYDWTGNLAPGAETNVTLTNTQQYAPGYHEIRSWVDDTLIVSGVHYRDHEPLNDTAWTRFVACSGALSGTITVATGTSATYQTVEEFLFAVSQCGVNGPLTVKIGNGEFPGFTLPTIPGISATNYIQFESNSGNAEQVTFIPTNGNEVVNMVNASHIRFKNIQFKSTETQNVNALVRLGINSTDCRFEGCRFVDNIVNAAAGIYSGGAGNITVDNCYFEKAVVGVSFVGSASDNRASGNKITHSTFVGQGSNAIVVRNQTNVVVDSNMMYSVASSAGYILLIQDCYGSTKITRNKIQTTKGASCIGATNMYGTTSNRAFIANNMIECNDDGSANQMITPMNIITAEHVDVVYNSIKMSAPSRSGMAAATFGGGIINDCKFYNNIVATFDNSNYALNYIPSTGNTNYIGYNIYYSQSNILNRYNGLNCATISAWVSHVDSDTASFKANPAFMNTDFVDLRSYNTVIRGVGTPIAGVAIDMFGTPRDASHPCVGAFEFADLPYDFQVLSFIDPEGDYCNVYTTHPIVVVKNNGVQNYDPTTGAVTVKLAVKPGSTITPGATVTSSVSLSRSIAAGDTIHVTFPTTVTIQPKGTMDSAYAYFAYTTSTLDPNESNDSLRIVVVGRYHTPALATINQNINYATAATIVPSAGVVNWPAFVYNSGAHYPSEFYWYENPTTLDPFYRGHSYTTGVLYSDTTLYVRQKRDLPLVRISEVQLFNNRAGVTSPMPTWMNSATQLAIELMNVGDYPANLEGDTLLLIGESAFNNKLYRLPNVTLQPGASIVVQYRTGINNVDSSKTIACPQSINPNVTATNNPKYGILYKDKSGMGVIDAVAFNDIINYTTGSGANQHHIWTEAHVPAAVWSGAGITLNEFTSGVIRKQWPSNPDATPSNSAQNWQVADDSHRMTLGQANTNLIRYVDNGCVGDVSAVNIYISNLPSADLAVDSIILPSGCGVSCEPITTTIHNYGSTPSGTFIARYSINGTLTCSDTITSGVAPVSQITHTFSQLACFPAPSSDVTYTVKVWVDHLTGDAMINNDSTSLTIVSKYTPLAPNVNSNVTVDYGNTVALGTITPTPDSLVWYDRHMNVLDTINNYETSPLYLNDTFYVAGIAPVEVPYHVGSMSSLTTATGYPSPYNPNKKFVREQYLYTADDLIAAGHSAGPITSVAFFLDTILNSSGSMTFTTYNVGIGTFAGNTFTNGNWATVSNVYSASNLTLTNSTKGWIRHEFATPFYWDGTSNVVVEICRGLSAAITQGAKTRYTTSANTVITKTDNTNSLCNNNTAGSRSGNRPDIQFGFVGYGCQGPTSPIYVTVEGTPSVDVSVSWPASMADQTFSSCDSTAIVVEVLNSGLSTITNYTADIWIDGTTHITNNGSMNLTTGNHTDLVAGNYLFTPGRHQVQVTLTVPNDSIAENNTVSTILPISFCGGSYALGTGTDFVSIHAAIDSLQQVGIVGPVTFNIASGVYQESRDISSIPGVSDTNTITFRGAAGNRDLVKWEYLPVANRNYVLNLSGASNVSFRNITFYAKGTGNYNNVVLLENSNNITFDSVLIRVKGTCNNVNASCMTVGENVNNLIVRNSILDSGYYSIKSAISAEDLTSGVIIEDNQIQNFWFGGIYMRKASGVSILRNRITSGVNMSGRALTGVLVAEHQGAVDIQRNYIALSDNKNGGKRGIQISRCYATQLEPSKVYNNMTSVNGIGVTGLVSSGIYIDSSEFVNVYFNSARVYAGLNALTTRAFSVESTSSGVSVMNNIFSNFSKGYSYYVKNAANVMMSDYNNYYNNADQTNTSTHFAYWGTTTGLSECSDLSGLRVVNNMDAHSLDMKPYFVSDEDLHLQFGQFVEMAQYNPDAPTDIDGVIRPQIPSPTIGAHEYDRSTHDVAVMEILAPTLTTDNVEADTLKVKVKFYNNGTSTEVNIPWYAEVVNVPGAVSPNRTIAQFDPNSNVVDSTFIPLPIGVIDTQIVRIHIPLNGDAMPENNVQEGPFYLDPAFNIKIEVSDVASECRMYSVPIQYTLTSVGRKDIPANYPINVGYQIVIQTAGVTIPTLTANHTETLTLSTPLLANVPNSFTFSQPANMYPTGADKDVVLRFRAWQHYQYDKRPNNDTTNYKQVTSRYTPHAPVANDLHIPYATWDTIRATQTDNPVGSAAIHRPIKWYRDSTQAPFYEPNNYNTSTWWATPQYFHDSVYYLNVVSQSASCPSYYTPVHVILNNRVAQDASVDLIVAPTSKVYTENDTVKVRIVNYGTQPLNNVPVVYQLRSGNANATPSQTVREICPATIQPGETYVYSFDSLAQMPYPTAAHSFYFRAWSDLASDGVHLNDSTRIQKTVATLPESQYTGAYNYPQILDDSKTLDIVRFAFSNIEQEMPPLGRDFNDFATFNNPELGVFHMIKGTTDTLIMEFANPSNGADFSTRVGGTVLLDMNRNGLFGRDEDEVDEIIAFDSVNITTQYKVPVTIPQTCELGYMRMRVVAEASPVGPVTTPVSIHAGHVQDYLIFVEEMPQTMDIALSRIQSPRSKILEVQDTNIVFAMTNKGGVPLTAANITYRYIDEVAGGTTPDVDPDEPDTTTVGAVDANTFNWTGTLNPGQTVLVSLPSHTFPYGTTDVEIFLNLPTDENHANDTLLYQYHRFETITLTLEDNFEGPNQWYAPRGYNNYTRNVWERGMPHKMNIIATVSDSNAWTTCLNTNVENRPYGNRSYLYSPIIDIHQIFPDTISFWMQRSMTEGNYVTLEFLNYVDQWVTVGSSEDTNWYNNDNGFTGNTSGYVRYLFSVASFRGDMQQKLQFRFVFTSKTDATPCEGAAIDDFKIGKARRAVDVGVVDIIHPTNPRFGQTINPIVVIKNYGYDTARTVFLGYEPYGTILPILGTYEGSIPPGGTDIYEFSTPFVVRNDFPDTFQITAYTKVNADIYTENDSVVKDFYLSPLENDMAAVEFVYPLEHVVAGDSVAVTMKLRNYGQLAVPSITVSYSSTTGVSATETVNFEELMGRPLESFEFFNYTFKKKFRATMGSMRLRGNVSYDADDYVYNDSISKSFDGIAAITDLRAKEIVVDESDQRYAQIELVIENVGARGANDFEVGFWYDNDTTTLVKARYHSSLPLAALTTGYYTFETLLPRRAAGYEYVTAYVSAVGDNDRTNDTTSFISQPYSDIVPLKVLVEENMYDTCHVRMQIENRGNLTTTRRLKITAVINGRSIKTNIDNMNIHPGEIYHLNFNTTIPKSPSRSYVGIGTATVLGDADTSNDQTNVIEVQNYFEGIPVADGMSGVSLEQNYPNPFDNSTRIDFNLPNSGDVRFFVMDAMGRLVYQESGFHNAGTNSINFKANSISTGVYYYGIEFEDVKLMKKMVFKK